MSSMSKKNRDIELFIVDIFVGMQKVVNFRNVIAHGYFGIDIDEVWDVLTEKLKLLKKDLALIIENRIDLTEAVASEIVQYKKLNDLKIVNFLNALTKKV